MKVEGVHITHFHQFGKLRVDLTYPNGHEKAGQPLDKICIIGQSGTGKTKLLEVIGGMTHNHIEFRRKYGFIKELYVAVNNFGLTSTHALHFTDTTDYIRAQKAKEGAKLIDDDIFNTEYDNFLTKASPKLIFYPAELKYEVADDSAEQLREKDIFDFSIENAYYLWEKVLLQIQAYQEEELRIRQRISRVAEDSKNDVGAIGIALKVLEDWKKENFNPIEDIAENCLNPLLEKFRLRVKTKLDIQKKDDIGFIKIEDFNGNEIPYGLWSTGTKQVVLSALPLYLLKPKHTIILFDEPERSLYPDLQRMIIDYYKQLTNDCQLFFATHSPIIASSFEPWEIVELKFNNEGKVYQEQYYTGERHIDNYTVNPDHLTYDLVLSKVFDLKETYPPIRDEKITEVLMLRNQLEKLKKENKLDSSAAKKIYERYMKLAQKLSWEFELPQYEEA